MDGPKPPREARIARARFRAWHRGTREADFVVGGFFDRYHAAWDDAALDWFEELLDEQDVDILAWALGVAAPAPRLDGPLMAALRRLDYVEMPG
ncbi:succinate dehydrogenase assembly factor 2 [Parablastomonas sp. CN1-191]|uniref:FAD assembly factor SdhE n=1 Tax=Parablastomonas sp. CN1-191 TaxID=3400908 RepID=UPI003BF7F2CF